ncbi:MAG: siphovirus ReqiPepy6 Gp37-like family protein [Christensenellales bacterium]|jgi:hypothetical protein
MELIFLDSGFNNISAPIDNYSSLQWIRRYNRCGQFSLVLSPSNYNEAMSARYIYNSAANETAIITGKHYEYGGKESLRLTGYMLEHMLSWRTPEQAEVVQGSLEPEIRRVVQKYAIAGSRAISKLELGSQIGAADEISDQISGKTLGDWLYSALSPAGLSYRIDYDYEGDRLIFSLWQGKDRTQGQSVNSPAVFSSEFENIMDIAYSQDDSNYKNFAYVTCAAADGSVLTVSVDNAATGEDRREMALAPSGIALKDEEGNPFSQQQLSAVLRQKGLEALEKSKRLVKAEGTVGDNSSLIYRKGYDLGDLCDFALPQRGIFFSARLTQITEVYEGGILKVIPMFGDDYLSLKELLNL